MIRTLLLLLILGNLSARASEPINAPQAGASASVSQPHVTAELIPETTSVQTGQPFDVALHLHSDPGWHTYWINPGDAGLATTINWTLPPGFTAGPIQWPTPEKHNMGPLVTYGYAGDVYLLTTITPPRLNLPRHFDVKASADWLVCKEECIPGHADLSLSLDSGLLNLRLPVENKDFFAEARERLPVPNIRWDVKASYGSRMDMNSVSTQGLNLIFNEKTASAESPQNLRFFPEQSNVLGDDDADQGHFLSTEKKLYLSITLAQNGEKPDKLSGILVSDQPLIGNAKSVYISEFPVTSDTTVAPPPTTAAPALSVPQQATGGDQPVAVARSATATPEAQPFLIAVLGAAFLGGLILNLMPCVLPVLSLKVFSLMKHAGENPRAAWKQGAAFTAGVVLSFWMLAGLLLALRAAGDQLGWGFQMQSPGFVVALIFLFFLLALNLFGVFELGSSLVGIDAKATSHLHGLTSSFLNGALATLAATPCTAPFMGGALGFAARQPPSIALFIFTFLALGMASPYLLLTIFPGALRFVPKPGAWMEAFRQFMGFLLMATVIFLIYVFGALVGEEETPWLLVALLLTGLAAWIYGRWATPIQTPPMRIAAIALALGLLAWALDWGITLAQATSNPNVTDRPSGSTATEGSWQPWSPAGVDAALAQGHPVFVDFTAAWCLSCKVNERLALETNAVQKAFADNGVALFKADWTHSDPQISQTLRQYNRDGVPLYLLYSPKNKDVPQVLPEVLTPGIVLNALGNL